MTSDTDPKETAQDAPAIPPDIPPATLPERDALGSVDAEVLTSALQWLRQGEPSWLATVVQTWGSSPRPAGSLLAANRSGSIVGSLSGGCVEDDLIDKLVAGDIAAEHPEFFRYGVTPEETERLGLPCGGNLDVVVEPLYADADGLARLERIQATVAARRCIERTLDLNTGTTHLADVERFRQLAWNEDTQRLTQTFGPRQQLFIIGAGMVSAYLAEFARSLEFDITVCDPREHLLNDFQVKGVRTVCDMPDDAIRAGASDAQSAIVALTHDPRIDDMGLLEALTTDAFYIGAMGSTRTSAARRERLAALDVPAALIDRLRAPIGLSIGSKTPPEIAIAILAEIIEVRTKNAEGAAAARSLEAAG
ncbi:MAG: XdhC family protein [Pseudomonadota bacterium]